MGHRKMTLRVSFCAPIQLVLAVKSIFGLHLHLCILQTLFPKRLRLLEILRGLLTFKLRHKQLKLRELF